MDRHRGDRYGDHLDSHRNSHSATPSWSSDDPVPHHDRNFDNHRGGFSGDGHHHHQERPHHHLRRHQHHSSHRHQQNINTEPNDSIGGSGDVGSGHSLPLSGRKRQLSHSGQGTSPDYMDGGSYVKLYVGAVPRTATEEDIRSLFKAHGNVVEVVLIKDKRTGQQQECCFVKYAMLEEADRAIGALHNQYTFPGGMIPIKVKYADGERERLGGIGAHVYKLYVGCLNKQASKRDIEEIFSPYGLVEDVYIVRGELKQSRGCAFVQFSHRDMAVAAINALHGTYVMRGCDQPLIVRFADPKKPRAAESRPAPYPNDPMGGHVLPNASHLISKSSRPEAVPPMTNLLQQSAPSVRGQSLWPLQQSHSQLLPSQQRQSLQESSQSPQAISRLQNQLDMIQLPVQTLEQEQSSQATPRQSPRTGSKPTTVSSTSTALEVVLPSTISSASEVPVTTEMVDPLDCDWSEHICPDGDKYYYNCVTCESRWEKPEEYTFYELQLQKQQRRQHPSCQEVQSLSHLQVLSAQQASQIPQVQLQTQLSHQQLQQPSLSAPELDHVHRQAVASPVVAPACV